MSRSRLILTLVFFLAESLQLWAQKPDCYRSLGTASDVDPVYVLIVPVPGTNQSKTIRFSVIHAEIFGGLPYVTIVTEFPDGHVTSDDYPANRGLLLDDWEKAYCNHVYPIDLPRGVFPSAHAAARAVASPTPVSTQSAEDFAPGDFNGDGVFDVASINGRTLSITLRGANNNTIGARSYTLPGRGATVLAVDVNGDGKADLIVSLLGPPGGIAVLLGNGDGTFQQANTYNANGIDATSVAAADFNADSKIDLAITNNVCNTANRNGVSVLLGNGDGSFRAPVNYTAGACPKNLLAIDLNGDGQSDLTVTDSVSPNIFVLPGRGDGTFNLPVSSSSGDPGNSINSEDFNNDGIPDLALTNSNHAIAILLGKGDGTFQAPVQYAAGAAPESMAVVKSGDGAFVALTFDRAANAIVLTPGTPQGKLISPVVQFIPSASQPALADATGDGKPDILLVNSPDLLVIPGDGAGNFGPPGTVRSGALDGYSLRGPIAVGDLNGDGITDVVLPFRAALPSSIDVGIGVMLGKTGGGFRPLSVTRLSDAPVSVVIGDFNNDGKADAAVLSSSGVSVLTSNGDGTFKPPVPTPVARAQVATAGDFNGDGKLDLFVAGGASRPIVLPGDGSGGFGAPVPVVLDGMGVSSAAVADFNGDQIPDLAVADVNSGQAAILLGNGDGTFRAQRPVAIDTNPFQVSIVDWNSDGSPDLVMAHCCGALESVVYLDNGDGDFAAGIHLPSGPSGYYLTAGDLTGQGKPGLVSVANAFADVNLRGAVTVVQSAYPVPAPPGPVSASPSAGANGAQK